MAVCYYDGSFAGIPLPPGLAPYDRLVILVASDGTTTLDLAGHRDTWKIAPPPSN